MVYPLGPGKFYGSSLPRPRIYTDVKFNTDRVDPPVSVSDPFLSWAQEAHWSMGGLSFQRLRFQGHIEGNAMKLRKFREKEAKMEAKNSPKSDHRNDNGKRACSVSPPPASKVTKRRKFLAIFDEDSEEEGNEVAEKMIKKRPARKLVGEFDKVATVATAGSDGGGVRTRRGGVGGDVMKIVEEVNRENSGKKAKNVEKNGSSPVSRVRTSPRLAKQRSSN
ncbi:uncharacterized protein LOC126654584 [Mercurialis annua]|uniref:uncharacterized protein LOC126654584 n=1 Tax=Mercurialis annua TaxID=3986 RepID=UPI00215F90C6|nr:uncharacterized protein LOC126654584 [Mercurialis annua]